MKDEKFKVAILQMKSLKNKVKENANNVIEYMKEAVINDADILLLPECFLTSYDLPIYMEDTLDIDDINIKKICEYAKKLNIGVVLTSALRISQDSQGKYGPTNSAIVINKDGKVLMRYDKVHTCDFADEAIFESGDNFYVCDYHGVKLGIMICYDREYPESARVLMCKGAEIILVPNDCGSMKPRLNALSTRAYENMVGVAMANAPGVNAGNSCAFSPICWDENGKCIDNCIVMSDEETQGLYYAEFDMNAIRNYRQREMMGNTFRKIKAYEPLLYTNLTKPFLRRGQGKSELPYTIKTKEDYNDILGMYVKGKIDRPLGTVHPRYTNLYYLVNYGYVEGILGGDGKEQDIYLLNVNEPVKEFEGKVIAVYHRYDDNEDKWIVIPEGTKIPSEMEILKAIYFQEKYFYGTLITSF